MSAAPSILVLNAGSSSLKFALFDLSDASAAAVRGEIENMETKPRFKARDADGKELTAKPGAPGASVAFEDVLRDLLAFIDDHFGDHPLLAVGHRVVHGGAEHIAPERLTPDGLKALEALIPLDPLHLPHNLRPIRALLAARPDLRQIVCFDTAFHHTMPDVAKRLAVPRALSKAGVRRYGFHGLSYEYISKRLMADAPALAKGRVVVAHLGSGASLCALKAGVSIETTMGFSVLDGLVMATRCGAIDPGAILYLARQGNSFAEIEDMLYRNSGLLGVSGVSSDIRDLIASADVHAREALDLFSYRAAQEIGAMASALRGLDGIVFTAGIGENAPSIRAEICARLDWLGVNIDPVANASGATLISSWDSRVEVRVIATDEEAMIAGHAKTLLGGTVS